MTQSIPFLQLLSQEEFGFNSLLMDRLFESGKITLWLFELFKLEVFLLGLAIQSSFPLSDTALILINHHRFIEIQSKEEVVCDTEPCKLLQFVIFATAAISILDQTQKVLKRSNGLITVVLWFSYVTTEGI